MNVRMHRCMNSPVTLSARSTYPTNVSLQRAATKSVANTSSPLIMTKSADQAESQDFYGSAHQVTCPQPSLALGVGVVSAAGPCLTLMGR